MFTVRRSQAEVFAPADRERTATLAGSAVAACCDYVEACATRVYGQHALEQQEILALGAGDGAICEELARRGAVMVGVERSPEALALARRRAQEGGLGHLIYYLEGPAEVLPFAEGAFSLIVCLPGAGPAVDLRAAVSEIARVLAPGGLFIFAVSRPRLLARLLPWAGRRPLSGQHRQGQRPAVPAARRYIKPRELGQLLSAHGLEPGAMQDWRLAAPAYMGYALRREQRGAEA